MVHSTSDKNLRFSGPEFGPIPKWNARPAPDFFPAELVSYVFLCGGKDGNTPYYGILLCFGR